MAKARVENDTIREHADDQAVQQRTARDDVAAALVLAAGAFERYGPWEETAEGTRERDSKMTGGMERNGMKPIEGPRADTRVYELDGDDHGDVESLARDYARHQESPASNVSCWRLNLKWSFGLRSLGPAGWSGSTVLARGSTFAAWSLLAGQNGYLCQEDAASQAAWRRSHVVELPAWQYMTPRRMFRALMATGLPYRPVREGRAAGSPGTDGMHLIGGRY